jgi:hypothetical protein
MSMRQKVSSCGPLSLVNSKAHRSLARAVAQQAVQIALGLNIQDPTVIQRLGSTPEERVCLTVLAARVNELYRSLMAGGSSA